MLSTPHKNILVLLKLKKNITSMSKVSVLNSTKVKNEFEPWFSVRFRFGRKIEEGGRR